MLSSTLFGETDYFSFADAGLLANNQNSLT